MTEPRDATWHPDPFHRHDLRYFDGTAWTEHVVSGGVQSVDSEVLESASGHVTPAAGWHADPTRRFAVRYWDGNRWTDHVAAEGKQSVDPLPAPSAEGSCSMSRDRGTLFSEPILVIHQKVQLVGKAMSYAILDAHGGRIGMVEELIPRSGSKSIESFFDRTDNLREYQFRIVDSEGRAQLHLIRPPRDLSLKSQMLVQGVDGVPIGEIVQETHGMGGALATTAHEALKNAGAIAGLGVGLVAGKTARTAATRAAGKSVGWLSGKAAAWASADATRAVLNGTGASGRIASASADLDKVGHVRFAIESNGARLATIHAETVAEWDFRIRNLEGQEIGRITKEWSGWAKERFTRADHYVIQITQALKDPLLSLVTAASLAIDIALKEGDPARDAAKYRQRLR